MAIATSVVIVRPEHLVSIKKRLSEADFVAVFSETEWLQVEDSILARPPEVLVMQSGDPVEYGTAEQVFSDPRHEYTRMLLDAVPRIDDEVL